MRSAQRIIRNKSLLVFFMGLIIGMMGCSEDKKSSSTDPASSEASATSTTEGGTISGLALEEADRTAMVARLIEPENIPGFMSVVGLVPPGFFPEWLNHLYHYAWFVGFFVGGFVYGNLMNMRSTHPVGME